MSEFVSSEVVVIGGGPAGMTTALYTLRLGHRTTVFEKDGGRHAAVSHVHNLYGVSEDVSGSELSKHAVDQFEEYGGEYTLSTVESVSKVPDGSDSEAEDESSYLVETADETVEAECVVFATGFTDVEPSVPGLLEFTGRGLHYCLHCDAYTLSGSPVFVLGTDEHAAEVAMLMLNFSADVDLLLDGEEPDWDDDTDRLLDAHPVGRHETPVVGVFEQGSDDGSEQPWLGGLRFADGTEREYGGGFAMYGKEYNTGLASSLGCSLTAECAIDVDDTQESSVDGVYAVGDVTHGQNQTVMAMADGARAGLAIHKRLREFPSPLEDIDGVPTLSVPAIPESLSEQARSVRSLETHAGLRSPDPRR